jgi:hypothetical protein
MKADNMRSEIRAHIARKYKTQLAAAEAWGLSPAFVNMVLNGKKSPSPKMLEDAGLERVEPVVTYRRKKKEKAE